MSFLLSDEENLPTIQELFAFIDCTDGCHQAGRASIVGGGDVSSSISLKDECHRSDKAEKGNTKNKIPKRRRKRIGWSSSTGLQRRKRAELLFLRQHVHDLEVYIQQLKTPPPLANFSIIKSDALMKEYATRELEKRLRSEEVNRVLKVIIVNQLEVHEFLRNVHEGDSGTVRKDD